MKPTPYIDRRVHKSKKALKQALLEWMSRKAFDSISITDIVKAADLNRGTFYKHYESKEQLLDDILDDVINDLIRSFRNPYIHYQDFGIQNLDAAAIKIFDHVFHYAAVYTILVNTDRLASFGNRIYETLKRLYLEDLTDKEPNPIIDKELMACYQSNAVLGLITEWVKSNFKYNSAYMAEQMLELTRLNRSNETYRSNLHLA